MSNDTMSIKEKAEYLRANNFWIGRRYSENFVSNLYDLASRKIISSEQWNKYGDASKSWDKQSRAILMLAQISDPKNVSDTEKRAAILKINGYWINEKSVAKDVIDNLYTLYLNGKISAEKWNKYGVAHLPWEKQSSSIKNLLKEVTQEEKASRGISSAQIEKTATTQKAEQKTTKETKEKIIQPSAKETETEQPISIISETPEEVTQEEKTSKSISSAQIEKTATTQKIEQKAPKETKEKIIQPSAKETETEQPISIVSETPEEVTQSIEIPKELLKNEIRLDFDGATSGWRSIDFQNNTKIFGSKFSSKNISFENGIMKIKLTPEKGEDYNSISGEYQSPNKYGYGYYEVRMKPAKGNFMGGSFFTYTGPSYTSDHHEIDLEFIKDKKTGKMLLQTNSIVEGKSNEEIINLDFDPSEDFHVYGFYWGPCEVTFFVDGKVVRRISEDLNTKEKEIPSKPGKIMMNMWAAGTDTNIQNWLGTYENNEGTCQYDYLRFIPDSDDLNEWVSKKVFPNKLFILENEGINNNEGENKVNDVSKNKPAISEDQKELNTNWFGLVIISDEEKKQAPFYNILNKMGYRLPSSGEKNKMPWYKPIKFLTGWL